MKITAQVLAIVIRFPIFMYIAWYILKTIEASELTMFLFYVYVPVSLLVQLLFTIVEWIEKNDKKIDKQVNEHIKKSFQEKLKEKS